MSLKRVIAFLTLVVMTAAAGAGWAWTSRAGSDPVAAVEVASDADITVFKSPTCGCCGAWIEHLQASGFTVATRELHDLAAIKQGQGVSRELAACHTGIIDGYTIEGHVPAADIRRLLAERPDVAGLAVPGMPMGSPGMEGPRSDAYDVLAFDRNGGTYVFNSYD